MKSPKFEISIPDGAKFCKSCGSPTSATIDKTDVPIMPKNMRQRVLFKFKASMISSE